MARIKPQLLLLQEYKSMDVTSMKGLGFFQRGQGETQWDDFPIRGILAMPG